MITVDPLNTANDVRLEGSSSETTRQRHAELVKQYPNWQVSQTDARQTQDCVWQAENRYWGKLDQRLTQHFIDKFGIDRNNPTPLQVGFLGTTRLPIAHHMQHTGRNHAAPVRRDTA